MPQAGLYSYKYAKIDCASSGDNTIITAVSGKRLIVVAWLVVTTGAVAVKFKDGASTDLTGAMAFAANGGASFASSGDAPAFETVKGNALIVNLGSAVQASGHVAYLEA